MIDKVIGQEETQVSVGDLGLSKGAALGNRTPDLRITRSPAHRPGRTTCTDRGTCVPECPRRTARPDSWATIRATARPGRPVTECY
jgi:hypothetical protein